MGYSWVKNWKVELLIQLRCFLFPLKIEESFQTEWLRPELNKQVEHASLANYTSKFIFDGLLFIVLSELQCNWLV